MPSSPVCLPAGREGLGEPHPGASEGFAGSDKAGDTSCVNSPALLQHQPLTAASWRPVWDQQPLREHRVFQGLSTASSHTCSSQLMPRGTREPCRESGFSLHYCSLPDCRTLASHQRKCIWEKNFHPRGSCVEGVCEHHKAERTTPACHSTVQEVPVPPSLFQGQMGLSVPHLSFYLCF